MDFFNLFAQRMEAIKPSPTLVINAKAVLLKSMGLDIISLAAGEPDFDTPDNVKNAAIYAINNGFTKYTAVEGIMELKKAICTKLARENNLEYIPDEIIVCAGGKQAIFNAMFATLNSTDEVLIPSPYWVSYPDIVLMCGAKPIIINCCKENNFKLTPDQLRRYINNNTKWLIINSPSNPSGIVYSKNELAELAKVIMCYPSINILSDDIYEHIIFTEENFLNILNVEPQLKSRTLVVNGLSKAYSMTGWRIGYGAGAKKLIQSMSIVQSQSTSNACSISQKAAVEALNGTQNYIKTNIANFINKRDLTISLINNINGLECFIPDGAFYIIICCNSFINKYYYKNKMISNDVEFCEYLLNEAHVATVPGSAFGVNNYFRISYATSADILIKAFERIGDACQKLIVSNV